MTGFTGGLQFGNKLRIIQHLTYLHSIHINAFSPERIIKILSVDCHVQKCCHAYYHYLPKHILYWIRIPNIMNYAILHRQIHKSIQKIIE